jgi:hypothetical protein
MAIGTIQIETENGEVEDLTYNTYYESGKLWHSWEVPVLDEKGVVVRYTSRRSEYAPLPHHYAPITESADLPLA